VGAKKSAREVDIAKTIIDTTSSIFSAVGLGCMVTPE
jgi:hypothetical protein